MPQMGGHGTFFDPRVNVSVINGSEDHVSAKLPALQAYRPSLAPQAPPAGSGDATADDRGRVLFYRKANCASCHSGALYTDANERLHSPSEVVSEPEPNAAPSYAARSATKMYRTAPLRGVWQHAPYFHNGTVTSLTDAVQAYNERQVLALTPHEVADIEQHLKSL